MTHRGPFQPRPFCDSVKQEVFGLGIIGTRRGDKWDKKRRPEQPGDRGAQDRGPPILCKCRVVCWGWR